MLFFGKYFEPFHFAWLQSYGKWNYYYYGKNCIVSIYKSSKAPKRLIDKTYNSKLKTPFTSHFSRRGTRPCFEWHFTWFLARLWLKKTKEKSLRVHAVAMFWKTVYSRLYYQLIKRRRRGRVTCSFPSTIQQTCIKFGRTVPMHPQTSQLLSYAIISSSLKAPLTLSLQTHGFDICLLLPIILPSKLLPAGKNAALQPIFLLLRGNIESTFCDSHSTFSTQFAKTINVHQFRIVRTAKINRNRCRKVSLLEISSLQEWSVSSDYLCLHPNTITQLTTTNLQCNV